MAIKKEAGTAARQAEFEGRALPKKQERGSLNPYHIRLYERDYEKLKAYFEDEGITISAGIRQALRRFMKETGIA